MLANTIAIYSVIVPLISAIINFKTITNTLKILGVFVFVIAIFEIVNNIHMRYGINNMYIFHIYSYIEFIVISFIFHKLFKTKKLKIGVFIASVLFYLFSILNLIYWESFNDFNSNQFAFEAVIIFFYCIGYYTELMTKSSIIHLEKSPEFILVSGYFIYFSGTFMLFISSKELLLTNNEGYWILNSVLNILLNTIYTVVLWRGRTKSI